MQEFLEQQDLKSISCRSFYILNDREKGLLVLNNKDEITEKKIDELMNVIGINTTFIYALDGSPDINYAHNIRLSMRSPWFWCLLTALIALFVFVGLSGIFWLSFWGSAGWFVSKFIMSSQFSSWRSTIGKN